MTAAKFDELIHQSTRLSIVGLLAAADWADFAFLRDELGLSDSALSKQLSTLEEAGYVSIERPLSEHRRRVRARLTSAGMTAFQAHVVALRQIIEAADREPADPEPADPEPADPEPADPEPADPEPADPEPLAAAPSSSA